MASDSEDSSEDQRATPPPPPPLPPPLPSLPPSPCPGDKDPNVAEESPSNSKIDVEKPSRSLHKEKKPKGKKKSKSKKKDKSRKKDKNKQNKDDDRSKQKPGTCHGCKSSLSNYLYFTVHKDHAVC